MTTELLPCPYCGNAKSPVLYDPDTEEPGMPEFSFVVVCNAATWMHLGGCGASTGCQDTPEEAIAAWNRRAPTTTEPTK